MRRLAFAIALTALGMTGPACLKADCKGLTSVCEGVCVDTQSDNLNCGACGNACGSGTVCGGGACLVSCAAGLVDCGGSCVNPQTDRTFCGASGTCAGAEGGQACSAGQVCSAGSCQVSCQPGLVSCDGLCIDPLSDRTHCGAAGTCTGASAGTACGAGQVCNAGACGLSCQAGLVNCGGSCVNPQTDRAFCGASAGCTGPTAGAVCAPGQVCSSGTCVTSCPGGEIACGGACVDPQSDPNFCGATAGCVGGAACGPSHACHQGACIALCAPGLMLCDTTCIDPLNSMTHCGASGYCRAGTAGVVCTEGVQTCVNGVCTPLDPPRLPGDLNVCPASLRASLPAGQHGGFSSAGQTRSFYLMLPPASFTGPRPLVVVFHGTGLSGQAVVDDYGLASFTAKGFVVAAPDSNGNGSVWPVWDSLQLPSEPPRTNPDDTYFDDLVSCVAGHVAIDPNRVFAMGHSAGGSMTHHLLGHRPALLAGGIAASANFDLTQPIPLLAASPLTAIVTWGGDNDRYTGSAGDIFVSAVGFAEQSAIGSQFWEARPQAHQVACRGNEVGHTWLLGITGWLADALLASPKGGGGTLPARPSICSEAAATYTPPVTVACGTTTTAGCRAYCQLLGDCLVENGTFGSYAAPALTGIGFGTSGNVCGGCLARCEADAGGSAPDTAVLTCLATAGPATACGPGFAGTAAFSAVSGCCTGATGSHVCGRFCAAFGALPLFASQLTACP